MIKKIIITTLLLCSKSYIIATEQAVVIDPVVDLIGDPLHRITKATGGFIQKFDDLPVSFQRGRHCPRLHQLLFNEQVTIIERYKDQVKVEIPNLFYQLAQSDKKQNIFWAPNGHFMPIDELKKNNIDTASLPQPIRYANSQPTHQTIISLIEPFADPITKKTYSIGTRFVAMQKHQIQNSYLVHVYDSQAKRMKRILIPSAYAFLEPAQKQEDKVNLFVNLLKQWAHKENGFIPYVWGGCSFTNPIQHEHFEIKHPNKLVAYFYRKESEHQHPKNGFDCSNLVARAAQICGIPYYFKNTTTALRNLTHVSLSDQIKNGDLLWYVGHIMIVSNVDENKLIEASSYDEGYGKVHEVPLNKIFKGINSYAELQDQLKIKQTIYRLTKLGTVSKPIYDIKILRLPTS